MNILEMVIMAVLIIIILGGVAIPKNVYSSVGSVPTIIIIMMIVFYLFTVSPILGVFAMIAGYELVMNTQEPTVIQIDNLPTQQPYNSTNQFEVTLEETIVKNVVPLVQSTTPSHLNFKYSEDKTYAAANAV